MIGKDTELICIFYLPYHNNVPKKIQFDSETTVFVSIVNINSKYSHDMSTEVLQDLSSFRREVKQ